MTCDLANVSVYRKGKVEVSLLSLATYISTENMLPNKGGITIASSLPNTLMTQAYKKDDILVSNIRPYFKKIWKAKYDGGCSNDVLVLTAKNGIDPDFLYYVLANDAFFDYSMAMSKGTKMPRGDKQSIMKYQIPLIELKMQKKIARFLRSIDEKIEANRKINDNLLNQIDSHFRALYIDFEQNNGLIPDNFRYGILDELSKEIICGKTPSTKNESYYGGDIPFITIPDMHDKVYVIKTERYLSEEGANSQIKKFVPKNSICVSCIGTAGLVALVNESSHTNQQINSIIPKENVSPYYVYSLMKTLKDKIISLGQCGSTIVNLNKVQFSKLEVLIPTEQSMSEFDQRVKPMFEQINLLQLENEKLSSLRDSLLPKLMSGEIDVDSIEL